MTKARYNSKVILQFQVNYKISLNHNRNKARNYSKNKLLQNLEMMEMV